MKFLVAFAIMGTYFEIIIARTILTILKYISVKTLPKCKIFRK